MTNKVEYPLKGPRTGIDRVLLLEIRILRSVVCDISLVVESYDLSRQPHVGYSSSRGSARRSSPECLTTMV